MTKLSTHQTQFASCKERTCQGRPPLMSSERRRHRITITFTDSEYQQLLAKVGRTAEPSESTVQGSPKNRRPLGSIAGKIRQMMVSAQIPLSVEQQRLLGEMANLSNRIDSLRRMAEGIGLLGLTDELGQLTQCLYQLLDQFKSAR